MIRDGIIYDITDDILRVDWVDKRRGGRVYRCTSFEWKTTTKTAFSDFHLTVCTVYIYMCRREGARDAKKKKPNRFDRLLIFYTFCLLHTDVTSLLRPTSINIAIRLAWGRFLLWKFLHYCTITTAKCFPKFMASSIFRYVEELRILERSSYNEINFHYSVYLVLLASYVLHSIRYVSMKYIPVARKKRTNKRSSESLRVFVWNSL